jgi:hypothetical protein
VPPNGINITNQCIGRPKCVVFCTCPHMLYSSICYRLRVFLGFCICSVRSRFRPEVISVTRRRGGPEVTSPSVPRLYFCICSLLTFFGLYLYPFKSYSIFSLWFEIAMELKFWGFMGILDPLMHAHIDKTPKILLYLHQTASFQASCMLVRRSVRPVCDIARKIIFFKYHKNKGP